MISCTLLSLNAHSKELACVASHYNVRAGLTLKDATGGLVLDPVITFLLRD